MIRKKKIIFIKIKTKVDIKIKLNQILRDKIKNIYIKLLLRFINLFSMHEMSICYLVLFLPWNYADIVLNLDCSCEMGTKKNKRFKYK
jgi:hypothetical protein